MQRIKQIISIAIAASALSACGASLGVVGVSTSGMDPDIQIHGDHTRTVAGHPAQQPAAETAAAASEAPRSVASRDGN